MVAPYTVWYEVWALALFLRETNARLGEQTPRAIHARDVRQRDMQGSLVRAFSFWDFGLP
jgi:hypothetical protein